MLDVGRHSAYKIRTLYIRYLFNNNNVIKISIHCNIVT